VARGIPRLQLSRQTSLNVPSFDSNVRQSARAAISRDPPAGLTNSYALTKVSKSALIVSASVVGMPWGKPL
jgi:hypothetical protein